MTASEPSSALAAALREGAEALGLGLDDAAIERLLAFLQLLLRWNKVYNLTAIRSPDDGLRQHLLDSLALIPPLTRHLASTPGAAGRRILDVGSGGGLPGVVLAIVRPDWTVCCVDAVLKKASFVRQVAAELSLTNLEALHGRVESMSGRRFEVVTCRAFAALPDFAKWTRRAVADDGVWVAMKGAVPSNEIAELGTEATVFHVEPLSVPGLVAERCLVWMRPSAPLLSSMAV